MLSLKHFYIIVSLVQVVFLTEVFACDLFCQTIKSQETTSEKFTTDSLYSSVTDMEFTSQGRLKTFTDLDQNLRFKVFGFFSRVDESKNMSVEDKNKLKTAYFLTAVEYSLGKVELGVTKDRSYLQGSLERVMECIETKKDVPCDDLESIAFKFPGKGSPSGAIQASVPNIDLKELQSLASIQSKFVEDSKSNGRRSGRLDPKALKAKWDKQRGRSKALRESLRDKNTEVSKDGESMCFVNRDLDTSQTSETCQSNNVDGFEYTKAFEKSYLSANKLSKDGLKKVLKSYCQENLITSGGKLSSREKRNYGIASRRGAVVNQQGATSFIQCNSNLRSDKGTCSKSSSSSSLLLPHWKKAVSYSGTKKAKNDWSRPEFFWHIEKLDTEQSTSNSPEIRIDCEKIDVEKYLKWSCLAKHGLPSCGIASGSRSGGSLKSRGGSR